MNTDTLPDNLFPILMLCTICGIYCYFFFSVGEGFGPYYGDEYFYLKNAESFASTGKTQASFTYGGEGSRIGGFDPHGPAYPIVYGAAIRMGLAGVKAIQAINATFLLFALLLISTQRISPKLKVLQTILLLGTPYALFYSFTLMPEIPQIFLAVCIYFGSRKLESNTSGAQLRYFTLIVLVAGVFRSTWFFAFVALGLTTFEKNKIRGLFLIAMGILLPYFSQRLFHEQVINTFSRITYLLGTGDWQEAMMELVTNTKRNIYSFIFYSEGNFDLVWKTWLLFSIGLGISRWGKTFRIRFGTVLLLIQLSFATLLYSVHSWTGLRMLTPAMLFLNLIFIKELKFNPYGRLVTSFGLISFILILPFQKKTIGLRNTYLPIPFPTEIINRILLLDDAVVRLDPLLLENYNLGNLPVVNPSEALIQYVMPYYKLQEKRVTHHLEIRGNQMRLSSKNIRSQ